MMNLGNISNTTLHQLISFKVSFRDSLTMWLSECWNYQTRYYPPCQAVTRDHTVKSWRSTKITSSKKIKIYNSTRCTTLCLDLYTTRIYCALYHTLFFASTDQSQRSSAESLIRLLPISTVFQL